MSSAYCSAITIPWLLFSSRSTPCSCQVHTAVQLPYHGFCSAPVRLHAHVKCILQCNYHTMASVQLPFDSMLFALWKYLGLCSSKLLFFHLFITYCKHQKPSQGRLHSGFYSWGKLEQASHKCVQWLLTCTAGSKLILIIFYNCPFFTIHHYQFLPL